MRLNCYCYLLASASLFLLVGLASTWCNCIGLPGAPETASSELQPAPKGTRANFELPKIFDFELFKQMFHKRYHQSGGQLEEPVRRKYMLARAFRAFVSAIKYKYRKISYHLALNHMSDKSPAELERMRNQMVAEGLAEYLGLNETTTTTTTSVQRAAQPSGEIPEVDPSEVEAYLARLGSSSSSSSSSSSQVEANEGDEFARIRREMEAIGAGDDFKLAPLERPKRQAEAERGRQWRPRSVHLSELINSGAGVQLDRATQSKVQLKPPGNNPNYEAPELISCGLRDDQLEELEWIELLPPTTTDGRAPNIVSYMSEMMSDVADGPEGEDQSDQDDDDDDDVVYFDHRQSKCMFLPRDQGDCGSCYAFGAVAIAEWLYCMKNGHLVPFSEQYIVDCGQGVGNRGCEGGNHFSIGYFLHNYGMELRSNYPYSARVESCPYDEQTDPKSMGYIRMELGSAVIVPMEAFDEYIRYSPLFITICTRGDFAEYKRGVHVNPHCNGHESDHVVVLIGHGREDGQDYWLIRNSHSIGWGEGGHYKLAKDSTVIHPRTGVAYGTSNGVQYHLRPNENQLNDKRHVRARYMAKLDDSLASDQFD